MMPSTISLAPRRPWDRALTDGALAATLSLTMLAWRGWADAGSAAAPINAVSHWIWPQRAFLRDDVSLQHTGTGAAMHSAFSTMWAVLYGWIRLARRRPSAANAVADAAAVAAAASYIDLKLVPRRLTPGFERRLSRTSLALVYASLGLGLALGGVLALRRD